MQELNNYFAGRFIKIAQVLLLDADLSQQARNAEFSNLRQIMVTLIKQRDISYMIYRMMYWLLIKEKKVILKQKSLAARVDLLVHSKSAALKQNTG